MGGNKLSKVSLWADCAIGRDGGDFHLGGDAFEEDVGADAIRSEEDASELVASLAKPMDELGSEIERIGRITDSVCSRAEEFDDVIDSAKSALQRLLSRIDFFLDENDVEDSGWAEISVVDFLKTMTGSLRTQFSVSGVELREDFWPVPLHIRCLPDDLSLSLRSLLINASEAASMSKRVGLDIEAWIELRVRDLGGEVEITVSNSGGKESGAEGGTPMPIDSHAFDTLQGALFRRALTLGAANRVVRFHCGSLDAECSGYSSKVRIRLPLKNERRFTN